jgi:hypothetical protein
MTARQILNCAVDSSQFFLFHPSDFPDVDESEIEIPDFALEEGLVVGLRLGADGARAIEICDGPLTEKDRGQTSGAPFVFRLDVRHGKLFATDRIEGIDTRDWDEEPSAEIGNGKYRAELYAIRNGQERNANWILALTKVPRLDDIAPWLDLPSEDAKGRVPAKTATRVVEARRVHHPKFGDGVIVGEEPGPTPKLIVRFADGDRKLVASFVKEI